MTAPHPPRQLRLIIEVDDFDEAVTFYRDLLGMPEQPAFASDGEDRVSILLAGAATVEIASRVHAQNIDAVEGAPPATGRPLRIALEVDDTPGAIASTERAGVTTLAPPVETPFRTINARVAGPAGWQVTFFQELEPLAERQRLEGFDTDRERPR